MSWTTKAGRFLSFMWKAGTTGVHGLNENASQHALEGAIDSIKGSFPELNNSKKAIVSSRPHSTSKADGRIDPLHVNFQIIDAKDQVITSAHFYASTLGGRYIWFSKSKYNNGQEARQHFPQDPAVKNIKVSEKQNETQIGQREA